jgi:ribonuclease HII
MKCLFDFDKKIKKGCVGALALNLNPHDAIIGTDEAGRGPGAGAVYAAAVLFKDVKLPKEIDILNDSKKLTQKVREELFEIIKEISIYSIHCFEVEEIERINILQSSLLAMKQSVFDVLGQVCVQLPLVLIDGNKKINAEFAQKTIIKGDSKSASIAAASVLAKVERDRYMCMLHEKYPQYNWAQNKGYLTPQHIEAIKKHGICEFHRKGFVKNFTENKPKEEILNFQ